MADEVVRRIVPPVIAVAYTAAIALTLYGLFAGWYR
jgi:hypothetical protein